MARRGRLKRQSELSLIPRARWRSRWRLEPARPFANGATPPSERRRISPCLSTCALKWMNWRQAIREGDMSEAGRRRRMSSSCCTGSSAFSHGAVRTGRSPKPKSIVRANGERPETEQPAMSDLRLRVATMADVSFWNVATLILCRHLGNHDQVETVAHGELNQPPTNIASITRTARWNIGLPRSPLAMPPAAELVADADVRS